MLAQDVHQAVVEVAIHHNIIDELVLYCLLLLLNQFHTLLIKIFAVNGVYVQFQHVL